MRLLGNTPVTLAVSVTEFEQSIPWIEADNYSQTIDGFLRAAQEVVEVASRRPLTPRDVEFEFDLVEGFRCWWMPVAPVTSITSITAVQPFVADVSIPATEVALQRAFDEPRLWFSDAALAIADPCIAQTVRVEALVGFEQGKAPSALKRAIILLVKEWYDAGVSIGDLTESKLSFSVRSLINQQRYVRPQVMG